MTLALLATEGVPWYITAIVSGLTGVAAVLGTFVALRNVVRRDREEHEDSQCLRAKRVFETFHDGMMVVNRDLVIVEANKQARAITGYSTDLKGRSIYELIPERFREQHRDHVARFFDNPHTRRMGTSGMQLWLVDRFGREKRVRLSLTPMEDEYGGMEVTVGMYVMNDEDLRREVLQ